MTKIIFFTHKKNMSCPKEMTHAYTEGGKLVDVVYAKKHKGAYLCQHCDKEVIPHSGDKIMLHFKHLEANFMSPWHKQFQDEFKEREGAVPEEQFWGGERRADIAIPNFKRIIEIQHSHISKLEVNSRNEDYKKLGHIAIWAVHAREAVLKKTDDPDRLLIKFRKRWQFESFKGCDYVYYDVDGTFFQIDPAAISKHGTTYVSNNGIDQKTFITQMVENKEILKMETPYQYVIYPKQMGAGSGKTYDILKNIDSLNIFYRNRIYLNKTHAGKHVTHAEFNSMYRRGEFKNITVIEDKMIGNGILIKYHHEIFDEVGYVFIITVDSAAYNLTKREKNFGNPLNMFRQLLEILISVDSTNQNGFVTLLGQEVLMHNSETIITIDEAQDLDSYYLEGFGHFCVRNHVDMCAVGDTVQTLDCTEASTLYLLRKKDLDFFKFGEFFRCEASNVCRRNSDPVSIDVVNAIIDFKKHGVPEMTAFEKKETIPDAVKLVWVGELQKNADDDEVEDVIAIVIDELRNLVDTYGYFPWDFAVVTLFTKNNPLANRLATAAQEFFVNKMETDKEYYDKVSNHPNMEGKDCSSEFIDWAFFHRSEEGTSIKLDDSKHGVRIYSTKSSKGDARKVVFNIGITEYGIKRFTPEFGLVYDSYLHVSITRHSERFVSFTARNGDDVCQRWEKAIEKVKEISADHGDVNNTTFDFRDKKFPVEDYYPRFYDSLELDKELDKYESLENGKQTIDVKWHLMRSAVCHLITIIQICNCDDEKNGNQNYMILRSLKKKNVEKVFRAVDHDVKRRGNQFRGKPITKTLLPILFWSSDEESVYYKCSLLLFNMMQDLLKYIEETIAAEGKLRIFCPLEATIVYHAIELSRGYPLQATNVNDMLKTINLYMTNFNKSGHSECFCKKYLKTKKDVSIADDYHFKFMETLTSMNLNVKKIVTDLPHIQWKNLIIDWDGINEKNYFNGFKTKISYFGYPKDRRGNDYHIICIKPTFSAMNIGEFLIKNLLDIYLLLRTPILVAKNTVGNLDDSERICRENLTIQLYVIASDLKEPKIYNLLDTFMRKEAEITNLMKKCMIEYFGYHHRRYYRIWVQLFDKAVKKMDGDKKNFIAKEIIKLCEKQIIPNETNPYIERAFTYLGDIDEGKWKKLKSLRDNEEEFIKFLDRFLKKHVNGCLYGDENYDEDEEED